MRRVRGTRRGLWLAAAGLALLAGCGGGGGTERHVIRPGCISDPPPRIKDGFKEPKLLVSKHGVLTATLKASYSPVEINGTKYTTMNYNGAFPGPTMVICPGDKLIIRLQNELGATPMTWMQVPPMHHMAQDLGQLTNLHTHGLHVSPSGNSDNVFVTVLPGRRFTYEYDIPKSHLPGLNWYHPHRHGFVENQIYAGMFGVLDIQGGLDTLPEIRDFPIRTLTLASLELGSKNAKKPVVVPTPKSLTLDSPYFINGQLNPEIDIHPGEVQRWQILNTNDNAIVHLELQDHLLYVLANDGISLGKITPQHSLLLGPGERREVLVKGGPEGTYRLQSLAFKQFQGKGNLVPETTIATLQSEGPEQDDSIPTENLAKPQDLRGQKIDQRHLLVFTERKNKKEGGFDFLINGKIFDPNRVDQVMTLNQVNEWTLENHTTEWHTFHIHVNDFQVISVKAPKVANVSSGPEGVSDVAPDAVDPADTVLMPPHSTVKLLTRPTDFTGKFVFHCHMTFHEDHGMMGVVKVIRPKS
jgi:FtsP/CotA-like multicopper oxidase with cupredoxin domain